MLVCCELSLELSCLPRASRLVFFCSFPAGIALCVIRDATESSNVASKLFEELDDFGEAVCG